MAKTETKKNGIEVQPVILKLPIETVAKLDRIRGNDSRVRYVNDLIKKVKEHKE